MNQKFTYTIASVNYNWHELTNVMIDSILKNLKSIKWEKIIIVDNSDNGTKFYTLHKDIQIIDNTNEQFCNLYKNKKIPSRYESIKDCYNGDQYHGLTINKLIEICKTDFLILFDSDTILYKDLDFLENIDKYITCCDIQFFEDKIQHRLMSRTIPIFQIFNLKMIKKCNFQYYEGWFNGETFLHNIIYKNIQYKRINHLLYVKHYGNASNKDYKSIINWIKENI